MLKLHCVYFTASAVTINGYIVNYIIAERLSARQLILLRISSCVCTWHALKVWRAHAAALLLSAGHSAQVLEYNGSVCTMDNSPYQGRRRSCIGAIKGRGTLRSRYVLFVQRLMYNTPHPAPLLDVYH